jgi:fermentation-respiration switch protein FrsA (DUF1100 family)
MRCEVHFTALDPLGWTRYKHPMDGAFVALLLGRVSQAAAYSVYCSLYCCVVRQAQSAQH